MTAILVYISAVNVGAGLGLERHKVIPVPNQPPSDFLSIWWGRLVLWMSLVGETEAGGVHGLEDGIDQ